MQNSRLIQFSVHFVQLHRVVNRASTKVSEEGQKLLLIDNIEERNTQMDDLSSQENAKQEQQNMSV